MYRNEKEWKELLKGRGALWIHSGDQPHARLTSGLHSDGYVDATRLTECPHLLAQASLDLIDKVRELQNLTNGQLSMAVKRVCGPATGAITLSYQLASILGARHCYTEHRVGEAGKGMGLKRFNVQRGEGILVTEDVLTTGLSTRMTIQVLEKVGANILPFILALVNRSGLEELDGRRLISLVEIEILTWSPKKCPLCKEGSTALRPKPNWNELSS